MAKVSKDTIEASRQMAWAKAMKVLFVGVAIAIGGAYISM